MFRKFLEPNKDRRPKSLGDLQKFLDDRWLAKGAEKNLVGKLQELNFLVWTILLTFSI